MSEQKTIYIADDETKIRDAIKAFLEKEGHHVMAFEDGDSLLEAFREKPADLVMLDANMPGTNGFGVCKELRRTSYVPIFMVTARDSDLDHQTALDLGCDDFFMKPVSPMTLVMRVRSLFKRIAYERETAIEKHASQEADTAQ